MDCPHFFQNLVFLGLGFEEGRVGRCGGREVAARTLPVVEQGGDILAVDGHGQLFLLSHQPPATSDEVVPKPETLNPRP